MVSIFAKTEIHSQIEDIVNKETRLHEVVVIRDILDTRPISNADSILIGNSGISFPLDWYNSQPPYLLPENIELNGSNLLGIIFGKLLNYEKAYEHLGSSNPSLFKELDFINRMRQDLTLDPTDLSAQYSHFENYRLMHNNAILRHYASSQEDFDLEKTIYFYQEAIKSAPFEEYQAFTTKQLALLLIDLHQPEKVVEEIANINLGNLSREAVVELNYTLCQAWMQQLTIPYDTELLDKLKSTLWDVLVSYEQSERNIETGLLLLDASHIANISDSFSESLGYVTRAIKIFEAEETEDLAGSAHLRKGTLLYTWAQKGNAQFFKPAIESYQKALKVFNKHEYPDVFADIHHNLGVLYTDLPTDFKKKSIWAGVAVSSFDEALAFYTKEQYPYQYGMICNNYANAYTKFPKAVLSDNHEKALYFYQEALDVRTQQFPYERAITLLNFLEASWDVGNDPNKEFNHERFQDMKAKANEVKSLIDKEDMIDEANKHLELLKQLEEAIS